MSITAVVQLDGEPASTRSYASVGDAADDIYNINATAILLGKGFSFNLTVTGGEGRSLALDVAVLKEKVRLLEERLNG